MASISQKLLGAGADAKNDWAHAGAATAVTFTGEAQFRRGYEIEIGIGAMATADAGLSKFVAATVRGNAFAEAKLNLRSQLPLNLFDDFGLVVSATAVAQAAAGIEAGLAVSVGDFIALLRANPESLGLPIEIAVMLLEEASIGGKFEVHVAAAAMAYATVKVSGELVTDPGFHVFVDAGLGLAAGVGFSGGLDLGLKDFRRFYGRAVDRTVDTVCEGVLTALQSEDPELRKIAQALPPLAKMSLRVAYEIGFFIAKNLPAADKQSALNLANHCVGVILEEAQRFLLGRFLEAGLQGLKRFVTQTLPNLAAHVWDDLHGERHALADVLRRMPAEPFQPNDDNARYWADFATTSTNLLTRLPLGASAELTRGMAMVFASMSLLREAIDSRINQASSYAFAIGAGGVGASSPPFNGPLLPQPSAPLRKEINLAIGHPDAQAVEYGDLLKYLVSAGVKVALRGALPEVDRYLTLFKTPDIGADLDAVLHALMMNRDAFVRAANGDRDPQATLRALLGVLSSFLDIEFNQRLVPAVNQALEDPSARQYFNEVIASTLLFTKNVAFQTVLKWDTDPVDDKVFTEALAGIITMLLGRSLVLVADGFMATLQGDMQRACTHAASRVDSARNPFTELGLPVSDELRALFADTLRIGGEIFGPLPPDTRQRLRYVLYDVFETLPPTAAAQTDLVTNLADQFFIPNLEAVDELKDELLTISRDRFQLFVERVLEAGAEFILRAIEDFINDAARTIQKWVDDIEGAIDDLRREIDDLARQIVALGVRLRLEFQRAEAAFTHLLEQFSHRPLRDRLRSKIADKIYALAKQVLTDNSIYRALPGDAKRAVRHVLRDFVDDAIQGPILDPIFDAAGGIAQALDGVLEDLRELNPEAPLAPQLLDLIVDRLEDRIRDAFGGERPRLDVGFDVNALGFSHHFSLGKVELNFTPLFRILRDAVDALDFYAEELEHAAATLATAFHTALELDQSNSAHSAKTADRDRLQRLRGEYDASPKSITIVNPAQSLLYEADFDVLIHLGGVPSSYLGLAPNEQQRVFVFVNGALIAPQAIALGEPFIDLTAPRLHVKPDAAQLDHAARAGNITTVQRPAVTEPAPQLRAVAPRAPSVGVLLQRRTIPPATRSQPRLLQSLAVDSRGTRRTTASLGNILPGRRLTTTKIDGIEQQLPAGITLRFRAELQHLNVGINSLAVVIIDPQEQRYQQSVSFAVSQPPAKRGVGARLPRIPGQVARGKPASPPIATHFETPAIAANLERGTAFFSQHSAAQLLKVRPK